MIGAIEQSAGRLGLQIVVVRAKKPGQIEPALAEALATKVDAVQFLASPFLHSQRSFFLDRLRELKLPGNGPRRSRKAGWRATHRASRCYRHVAVLVAKVLRGARPQDLPIEQPTSFTLALNTGTAKAIGLQIPGDLLLRADVVVD